MGNDPEPVTNTTKVNLTPEQKALQGYAMPQYKKFAEAASHGGITAPGAESVSPFDPLQTQGQEAVLANTGEQQNIVGSAGQASQFLTSGDALSPDANPALRATQEAAIRPIYEHLTSDVLPGIRGEAVTNGQYGGSREGIAEGIAARSANNAAGDASARVASAGYGQGLDAMKTALGLAPGTATAQSIPGATTSGVGDIRQELSQKLLSAGISQDQFQQWLPFLVGDMFNKAASGTMGGSTTSTGTAPQGPGVPQMLAGAGSILGGLGAAGGSGGIAALLPMIGSDQNIKEDIVPVGTLFDGQTVYRYRYKGGNGAVYIGLMAQEVEKVVPGAVAMFDGMKYVEYGAATQPSVDVKELSNANA